MHVPNTVLVGEGWSLEKDGKRYVFHMRARGLTHVTFSLPAALCEVLELGLAAKRAKLPVPLPVPTTGGRHGLTPDHENAYVRADVQPATWNAASTRRAGVEL